MIHVYNYNKYLQSIGHAEERMEFDHKAPPCSLTPVSEICTID